jgi:hypothetical protein
MKWKLLHLRYFLLRKFRSRCKIEKLFNKFQDAKRLPLIRRF